MFSLFIIFLRFRKEREGFVCRREMGIGREWQGEKKTNRAFCLSVCLGGGLDLIMEFLFLFFLHSLDDCEKRCLSKEFLFLFFIIF
jgi:hypothetical protein